MSAQQIPQSSGSNRAVSCARTGVPSTSEFVTAESSECEDERKTVSIVAASDRKVCMVGRQMAALNA